MSDPQIPSPTPNCALHGILRFSILWNQHTGRKISNPVTCVIWLFSTWKESHKSSIFIQVGEKKLMWSSQVGGLLAFKVPSKICSRQHFQLCCFLYYRSQISLNPFHAIHINCHLLSLLLKVNVLKFWTLVPCWFYTINFTVKTLMKCSIMLHFIWVFIVCNCTHLGERQIFPKNEANAITVVCCNYDWCLWVK